MKHKLLRQTHEWRHHAYYNVVLRFFFFRLSELFHPLLARLDIGAGVEHPFGCLIVQNRQAVLSVGVDGLDSGGRHGRRFVLRLTHRPQRRPYSICTGRSRNVRHRCGDGWAGPKLFLARSLTLRWLPSTVHWFIKCMMEWEAAKDQGSSKLQTSQGRNCLFCKGNSA